MLDAIHKHDSSFTENAVFLSLPMIFFHYLESCGLLQAACDVFYWSNVETANYRNAVRSRGISRDTIPKDSNHRTREDGDIGTSAPLRNSPSRKSTRASASHASHIPKLAP